MDRRQRIALQQQFEQGLIKKSPDQWEDGTFFTKDSAGNYTYNMTDALWHQFLQTNPVPVFTDPKQVIVVRRDLEMPAGKLAAQVAHASMAPIINAGEWTHGYTISQERVHFFQLAMPESDAVMADVFHWMRNAFGKVVLEVYSEEQMNDIWDKVQKTNLPQAKIVDGGRTTFNEPTLTCVGIGPGDRAAIDRITGDLKLYGTAKLKEDGYYYGRKKLADLPTVP